MRKSNSPAARTAANAPADGYKRAFDLVFIIMVYLLFAPLWLLLWLAIPIIIWLEDGGPVFYIQERVGWRGKHFKLIKFRTMIPDAENLTGPVWATRNDPRLTKVGKRLRWFHLDEIPQVVNILRGDMSLVGPRPERPVLAERFDREAPGFSQRLRVRPGIAGLAQVRGGYWIAPSDKLRYDNLYIKNMGPWLDLKLLLLSTWVAVRRVFSQADVPARRRWGKQRGE